jgi:ribosomal protein L20A (L18A)
MNYNVKISHRKLTDLDINGTEGQSTYEASIKLFKNNEELIEEFTFAEGTDDFTEHISEYDFTNPYNLFKAMADQGKNELVSTIAHLGSYTLVDREIKVSNEHILEVLYSTIGSSSEVAKRLVDLVIENTVSKIQNDASNEQLKELIAKLILHSVREEELNALKIYEVINDSLIQKV